MVLYELNSLIFKNYLLLSLLSTVYHSESANNLDINKYYKELLPEDIIMSYKGAPSEDLLNSLLSIAEGKLSLMTTKGKLRKKLYHILIEAIQNIHHHFDHDEHHENKDGGAIIFVLSRNRSSDESYSVIIGNYISFDEIPWLKSHLERINAMDRSELREFYRNQLHQGELSEKGGAGLGMIDIARRSGNPLDFSFRDCHDGRFFFSLKVNITA